MIEDRYCAYCGQPEHEAVEIGGIKVVPCPAIPDGWIAQELPPVDDPRKALAPA